MRVVPGSHRPDRPARRYLAGLVAAATVGALAAAVPTAGAGTSPGAGTGVGADPGVTIGGSVHAAAVGGTVDAIWAGTGLADLNGAERVDAIAEAPDGNVVVTGFDVDDVMVARFDPAGRLDPAFDGDGRAYADVSGVGRGTAVAVQPDGKVLVGGTEDGGATPILLRFQRDGRLDPTFGTGGVERRLGLAIAAITVRADGTILLAGREGSGASTAPRLERHLADGSPDTGFGASGAVTLPTTGADAATAVVALPDGKALVGWTRQTGQDFTVARILATGALDPAFGAGGITHAVFASGPSAVSSLVGLADGSVVAAGTVTVAGSPVQVEVAVARWRADGNPETGFAATGRVVVPATAEPQQPSGPTLAVATGLRPDGRIVVVAGTLAATTATISTVQLLPDGTADTNFGQDGLGTTTATRSGFPLDVPALLVGRDGRALAAVSDGRSVDQLSSPFVMRLVTSASSTANRQGYLMLDASGRVYAFGDAVYLGDPFPQISAAAGFGVRAVDIAATASGNGYWVVDNIGRVFSFGDAPNFGDVTIPGNPTVSIARTPNGYIGFAGDLTTTAWSQAGATTTPPGFVLNQPVVDAAPAQAGGTYAVAGDGGIFALGGAPFLGSMGGTPLNQPVTGLAPDPDGRGYWLVAADGGIFAFDAVFKGSMGATPLNQPVSDMVPWGDGYLLVGADGGIFAFGNGPFAGSLGNIPPANPVVAVTAVQT